MKNFSIFEQALKYSGVEETENLGEITSLARRDFIERESFICHTTTASVEYACLMIENADFTAHESCRASLRGSRKTLYTATHNRSLHAHSRHF